MNKIFLIGNLTGDPELRTTPNGITVCTMNLAVNRRFSGNREERQTDFYRVTAWRQLGETCSRFLSKGKKIAVVGEFVPRTYEGKDGATRVFSRSHGRGDRIPFSARCSRRSELSAAGISIQPAGLQQKLSASGLSIRTGRRQFLRFPSKQLAGREGQQSARDGFAANSFDSCKQLRQCN